MESNIWNVFINISRKIFLISGIIYSFQEDSWHAWDYQLGSKKVPFQYWEYTENNTLEENRESLYSSVKDTFIWDVLTEELDKTNK